MSVPKNKTLIIKIYYQHFDSEGDQNSNCARCCVQFSKSVKSFKKSDLKLHNLHAIFYKKTSRKKKI